MLEKLEKVGNKRPTKIITRSPNRYPNFKKSIDIKLLNKNEGSVVIFDDMLRSQNSSQTSDFYTRVRRENLHVSYISQRYFNFPRQTIRNNSDMIILFKQALKDVQSM